jgi:hypothetical protein
MIASYSCPVVAVDPRGALIAGAKTERVSVNGYRKKHNIEATPSRYRAHLKRQIVEDAMAFHALTAETPGTRSECLDLMHRMQPSGWAHTETKDLHAYVLGTIYHASSMRAHICQSSNDWHTKALGILRRGVPPILNVMAHDLC